MPPLSDVTTLKLLTIKQHFVNRKGLRRPRVLGDAFLSNTEEQRGGTVSRSDAPKRPTGTEHSSLRSLRKVSWNKLAIGPAASNVPIKLSGLFV